MTSYEPHLPPLANPPLSARQLGITSEAIEKLAFKVYVENGSIDGRTFENWTEAERRLMHEYLPRPAVRRGSQPVESIAGKAARKTKKAPPAEAAAPAKKRTTRGKPKH